MKKYIFIALAVLLPLSQTQAAWTAKKQISLLKSHSGGLTIVLQDFSQTDPSVSCTHDRFSMPISDPNYDTKVSFLLAAYMSQTSVYLSYYGCESNGEITLGSVQFQ